MLYDTSCAGGVNAFTSLFAPEHRLMARTSNLVLPPAAAIAAAALIVGITGCGRQKSRIRVPNFSPSTAARLAFSTLDTNIDGKLSGDELRVAPGIASARQSIDVNRDGAIDEQELTQRLQYYLDSGIGVQSLTCIVKSNGQSLPGATVDFEPSEFFEGALSPARASTARDGSGAVMLTDGTLPGIAPGIYKVRVSKKRGDRELLPSKYNLTTILGFEVSPDSGGEPARFDLQP
jgi:hypothetical protein